MFCSYRWCQYIVVILNLFTSDSNMFSFFWYDVPLHCVTIALIHMTVVSWGPLLNF